MALQDGVDQRIPVYCRVLLVDVAGNYYGITDEGIVTATIPGTNHHVVACKTYTVGRFGFQTNMGPPPHLFTSTKAMRNGKPSIGQTMMKTEIHTS